jgi:transposase
MGCHLASAPRGQAPGGRPRTTSLREVVNTIFYVNRSGGAWRMLPRDFPPYQTVYRYFRTWSQDGTSQKVHDVLRDRVRQTQGHETSPSAAAIDSQSVKTTGKGLPRVRYGGRKSRGASGISSSTRKVCPSRRCPRSGWSQVSFGRICLPVRTRHQVLIGRRSGAAQNGAEESE